MKKVLVTGATGFIGGYVVNALLQRSVRLIATSSDKTKASARDWFTKVEYVEFDLKSFDESENYYRFFGEPDLVIHLAWEGLPNYKDDFHLTENLPRHFSFLRNLVSNGLKDLTVTGTCLEYGMQEGCLKEDMPAVPTSAYPKAKLQLLNQLQDLQKVIPFSLKWARLFYMYGRGQNVKSLFSQLDQALENKYAVFNMSGGEQVRDFLPVKDVAEYIVSIALQRDVNGVINCCSGEPVKIIDLVNQYMAAKNQHIKLNLGYYGYPDYEPMRFWGDNSKLNLLA